MPGRAGSAGRAGRLSAAAVDLTDETCEVVLTIGPVRRKRISNEQKLSNALRSMRQQGFELELFIRGTWQRECGGLSRVLAERRLDHWHWDGRSLRVADSVGSWMPATGRDPASELVLRGVRRRVG